MSLSNIKIIKLIAIPNKIGIALAVYLGGIKLKKYKVTILNLLINKILPSISYLLIILSISLGPISKNSMLLYRDLIYRNKILNNAIFTKSLLNIYLIIIILGVLTYIVLLFRNKNERYKNKINIYITLILSISSLSMIILHDKATGLSYPWILLSLLISLFTHYIKSIYSYRL